MTAYNPYQSVFFQIERIKSRMPKQLAEEYLVLLTTLYGRRFEEGVVRVKDYHDMTMRDIADEIVLRTKIMRADNTRKIEKQKEKEKKEQEEAIRELILLQ